MATGKTPRKVESAEFLALKRDEDKGRYVTAKKHIDVGTKIFSEEPFAAIRSADEKNNIWFCCHCFKEIKIKSVLCFGCSRAIYCSKECKIASWKCHHWMECFMSGVVHKMKFETRLALRTLLEAGSSVFGETGEDLNSISKVAAHLSSHRGTNERDDTDPYRGNYWDIYCLQRHEDQHAAKMCLKEIENDVKDLSQIFLKCFAFYAKMAGNVISESCIGEMGEEKVELGHLLQSFFKTLCFKSYYENEHFEIELWRQCIIEACEDLSKKGCSSGRSLQETVSQKPKTRQQLLVRLLVHHALQVRTNTQAIFRICETEGFTLVQSVEQKRIAAGFFPITSLLNHSCTPNTSVSFSGRNIAVIAIKDIKKGEEICHCYGPHHSRHSLKDRQTILREQYFFTCSCAACTSESADDEEAYFKLQFHAFKCKFCGEPLNPGKSENTKNTSPNAICINEDCQKKQNLKQSVVEYEKMKVAFENTCKVHAEGKVEDALSKFKSCLKTAEKILYHNHIDIATIQDKIAQCFVLSKNYSAAIQHLSKSIAIIGMLYGTESVEIAHELQKLASLYFNQVNLKQAAKIAHRVVSIYKRHYSGSESLPPGAEEMELIIQFCAKSR